MGGRVSGAVEEREVVEDGGAALGKMLVTSAMEKADVIGRGDDEMAEETRMEGELRLRGGKTGEVGGVSREVGEGRAGEAGGGGGGREGASRWVEHLSNLLHGFFIAKVIINLINLTF